MKYFGVDFGKKRIGVSIGDSISGIASPFLILINDNSFFQKFIEEIKKEEIDEIVIGMPESLTKNEDMKKEVLNFVDLIKQKIKIPIHLEDEKFTSKIADRLLGGYKKDNDSLAAAIILQTFLDKRKNL